MDKWTSANSVSLFRRQFTHVSVVDIFCAQRTEANCPRSQEVEPILAVHRIIPNLMVHGVSVKEQVAQFMGQRVGRRRIRNSDHANGIGSACDGAGRSHRECLVYG